MVSMLGISACSRFYNLGRCHSSEYGAETALEETKLTAVGEPGLRAIEESGQNHSPVDLDLCFVLQVSLATSEFVQFSNGTICLWESIVNSFVDSCIRWVDVVQTNDLLCWFQFDIACGMLGRRSSSSTICWWRTSFFHEVDLVANHP